MARAIAKARASVSAAGNAGAAVMPVPARPVRRARRPPRGAANAESAGASFHSLAEHLLRRGLLREHLVERRAQLAEARLELGAVPGQHVEEAAQLRVGVAPALVHVD